MWFYYNILPEKSVATFYYTVLLKPDLINGEFKSLKKLLLQVAYSSLSMILTSSDLQANVPTVATEINENSLRDSDSKRNKPQLILKQSKNNPDYYIVAGHRSHRSHSSHRSHYSSGGSRGGGGSGLVGLVVGGLALYGAYSVFKDFGGKDNK